MQPAGRISIDPEFSKAFDLRCVIRLRDNFVSDLEDSVRIVKLGKQYLIYNGTRAYCMDKYRVSLSTTSSFDMRRAERKHNRLEKT
jgi:hypothetical protein